MKKTTKENLAKLKIDLNAAVRDKKRWLFCGIEIAIVILLIVFDMLTKKYIFGYCQTQSDIIIIKDVIRFTAVTNTGAGFGILKDKTMLLTIISLISAMVLVVLLFYSYPRRNKLLRSALVLIIGGAVGNLIDRMFLGYVRDFVYFELINFAIFNFADSFLTIGTVLLIIYVLFYYGKDEIMLKNKCSCVAETNQSPSGETADTADNLTASDESVDNSEKPTNAGELTTNSHTKLAKETTTQPQSMAKTKTQSVIDTHTESKDI